MVIAATCFKYGPENMGLIAATGCNTVYTSTYPYNPYKLPWSNSLFENAPTFAMGVRAKWDQQGWGNKRLWVIGGDGAMMDIGFQALSRMLMSGMDIKVIVLDTQVYSNTGGQASTSTFMGQNTKMSVHGKEIAGKTERRKELAQIIMAHPEGYVAQTTAAHVDRKSTRLNSSHLVNSYAVFCLKKKKDITYAIGGNYTTEISHNPDQRLLHPSLCT